MDSRNKRLRTADEGFADACDQVNRLLSQVEAQAVENHPGRPVYVHILSEEIEEIGASHVEVLSLAKLDGRWRLAYGCGLDDDPSGLQWTPIAEASIERRLAAARVAPKFLDSLLKAREAQVQEARAVAATLAEALAAFETEA